MGSGNLLTAYSLARALGMDRCVRCGHMWICVWNGYVHYVSVDISRMCLVPPTLLPFTLIVHNCTPFLHSFLPGPECVWYPPGCRWALLPPPLLTTPSLSPSQDQNAFGILFDVSGHFSVGANYGGPSTSGDFGLLLTIPLVVRSN